MKVVLVGDSGSGKTCLIGRYIEARFINLFVSTIGVDFKIKTLHLDNEVVQLQIFDTAGQERYRSIVTSYYRQSDAVVIAFDLTSRETFENISYWINQVNNCADPNVLKVIVGTKSDLKEKRIVTPEECEDLAKQYNCKYYETSALQDENVTEMFLDIAKEIKKHAKKTKNSSISTAPKETEQQSCC